MGMAKGLLRTLARCSQSVATHLEREALYRRRRRNGRHRPYIVEAPVYWDCLEDEHGESALARLHAAQGFGDISIGDRVQRVVEGDTLR